MLEYINYPHGPRAEHTADHVVFDINFDTVIYNNMHVALKSLKHHV